jgi:hypothetical protein
MTAKSFKIQCAQGDTYYRRVDAIPATATRVTKWDGKVAHSETGHDHMFRKLDGLEFFTTPDPFVCYLRCESAATLEHLRDFDTHAPILFDVGTYEVRRQREHTPEGFRRIED